MQTVDLIRRKRDGGTLSTAEIRHFVAGVVSGSIADYQASAFLMAAFLRGMSLEETVAMTQAMAESGDRLDLSAVPGPKVDKHSTGGVGDKLSLVIAPLAAACGLRVPMLSGRALEHTGGTIDKVEAIPGFRTNLSLEEVRQIVTDLGCVITSPTREIAPADRTLYALRDVTATVDSIPLICASILSKKLAEGLDGLVMDVKVGRGAFMKTEADARALAERLVAIGNGLGVNTEALLTSMDEPLGCAIGNALEVREAADTLAGRGPADVTALSVLLTARMLRVGRLAGDDDAAHARAQAALDSGAGFERFQRMVARQGGDASLDRLPQAHHRRVVAASRDGYLAALDAYTLGRTSMRLGGGRERAGDPIDPSAGLLLRARPGALLSAGDPILELHFNDEDRLPAAMALAETAIHVTDEAPPPVPLVLARIG